jgi:CO dehydrogenase/acetyl-CoA synthase gamma subunit (corrinoid Fe-S protein)
LNNKMNRPIQMYLVKICEEISAKIWEVLFIKSSEIRYMDISVDNSMYNMIDFICLYLSNSIL